MNTTSARHAYLIMAHHQFELLKLLLSSLDDARNDIYLHIDRKVKNPPIKQLQNVVKKSSLILTQKRYDVAWGSAEQSLAEMLLYKTAATSGKIYTYYHLLSGSCLPVKSQNYIHDFFSAPQNAGKNFCTLRPKNSQEDYIRFSRYHFKNNNLLTRLLNRIQNTLKIDRIRGKFPFFGRGQNWCSLTHEAVSHLLQHEREIRALVRFTRNSDEGYKQLFLLNAPHLNNRIKYDKDGKTPNLWYTDWSSGGAHPRTLTEDDSELFLPPPPPQEIHSTPILFARKFCEEHIGLAHKLINQLKEEQSL